MKVFLDKEEMLITDSYIKTPNLVISVPSIASIAMVDVFIFWRYLWVLPAVGALLLSVASLSSLLGWCLLALTIFLSLFTYRYVSGMQRKHTLMLSLTNGETYLFRTRSTQPGEKVSIDMHNQHVQEVYEALLRAIVD